jgi:hypothetical protein
LANTSSILLYLRTISTLVWPVWAITAASSTTLFANAHCVTWPARRLWAPIRVASIPARRSLLQNSSERVASQTLVRHAAMPVDRPEDKAVAKSKRLQAMQ